MTGAVLLLLGLGVPGPEIPDHSTVRAPEGAAVLQWVEDRVRALQPTREERRLDEIGWADGILEAERLARENRRPVFLFTLDGRMGIGRC